MLKWVLIQHTRFTGHPAIIKIRDLTQSSSLWTQHMRANWAQAWALLTPLDSDFLKESHDPTGNHPQFQRCQHGQGWWIWCCNSCPSNHTQRFHTTYSKISMSSTIYELLNHKVCQVNAFWQFLLWNYELRYHDCAIFQGYIVDRIPRSNYDYRGFNQNNYSKECC